MAQLVKHMLSQREDPSLIPKTLADKSGVETGTLVIPAVRRTCHPREAEGGDHWVSQQPANAITETQASERPSLNKLTHQTTNEPTNTGCVVPEEWCLMNDAPDCPLVSTCTGIQMHVSLFTPSPTHLDEHAHKQLRKTRTLTSVWQQGDISQTSIQMRISKQCFRDFITHRYLVKQFLPNVF